MRKLMILKPLFIHLIITLLAIIIFETNFGFGKLISDDFVRYIIYGIDTVVVILLYLFLSNRFLRKISKNTLLISVGVLLSINLILGLSGFLMMRFGSYLVAETGQLPIIILANLNVGFFPLISLLNLPEFLGIIFLCVLSPLFLYVGSRITSPIK